MSRWPSTAQVVTEIRVPRGEIVYGGAAGAQPFFAGGTPSPMHSGLVGGGPQVYLPNVDLDEWMVGSSRFTDPGAPVGVPGP